MQVAIRYAIHIVKWCWLLSIFCINAAQAASSLQLTDSSPSNNATDIARTGAALLRFSADLDPASVASGQIRLRHNGVTDSITLQVAENRIVIFFDYELLPDATYTISVSNARGRAGEQLNSAVNIVFRTRDGTWQSAQPVVTNGQYISSGGSRFAFDKRDDTAMTAWTDHTGLNHTDLFASYYSAGQWSAPQLVNTNDSGGEVFNSAIAMGGGGGARIITAVWEEYYATGYNNTNVHFRIWANQFTPASGWGTPQLIDTDSSSGGFNPEVAVSPYGKAVAVWYQYDHGTGRIFSSEYTPTSGWSVATAIDAFSQSPGSFNPHIAFDGIGNGYAIWQQWWHGVTLVWGNRYVANRGWIAPQIIQSDRITSSDASQIAFDGHGNAIAVWTQASGVYAARYLNDQGWGAAVPISNDSGYDDSLTIAVNRFGDAFVAWTQIEVVSVDGHGIPHTRGTIWGTRFTVAGGWEAPNTLQYPNGYDANNASLAVDDAGNALALWSGYNGTFYRIYADRYQAGIGWVGRKVIDTNNTLGASNPHVAIDLVGNAFAVWEQRSPTSTIGSADIWFNQFK